MLDLVLGGAPVDLDEVKRHPHGYYHQEQQFALAADPATAGRFSTMPGDVLEEIGALRDELETPRDERFAFLLINRRNRHRMNSMGGTLPDLLRMMPYNVANMNPADMASHDIAAGDRIEVQSDNGTIEMIAHADETVRRGVLSISHGFGGIPGTENYLRDGVSPNMLISTDRDLQTINAMPRMTAIPINIRHITAADWAESASQDRERPTDL